MDNPIAKEFLVLLIVIFSAYGFHCVMRDLRTGRGFWGHLHHGGEWLANRHKHLMAADFLGVNAFGWSLSGALRKRHMNRAGYDPNDMPNAGQQLIQRNGNPPGRLAGFFNRIAGGGGGGGGGVAVAARNAAAAESAKAGIEEGNKAPDRATAGRMGRLAGQNKADQAGAATAIAAGVDPAIGIRAVAGLGDIGERNAWAAYDARHGAGAVPTANANYATGFVAGAAVGPTVAAVATDRAHAGTLADALGARVGGDASAKAAGENGYDPDANRPDGQRGGAAGARQAAEKAWDDAHPKAPPTPTDPPTQNVRIVP